MGTDIHMAVEVRGDKGKWHCLEWPNKYYGKYGDTEKLSVSAYSDRNYDVFAILAHVRNGSGFAGVVTGEGFNFISHQRGLPKDVSSKAEKFVTGHGDHSTSYVTLREILEFDWSQITTKAGWVIAKDFEKWDRVKEWDVWPDEWCADVSGDSVEKISTTEMRRRVKVEIGEARGNEYEERYKKFIEKNQHAYCQITWEVSYADAAKSFWVEWVPRLLRLGKLDDVRCVFSFDS